MQKSKLIKLLSFALSIMMILCAAPFTAFADGTVTVTYLDADGKTAQAECTPLASDTAVWTGWYVVDGKVDMNHLNESYITLYDDANIILKDGAALTVRNAIMGSAAGKTLTVYAQSKGDNAGKMNIIISSAMELRCINGNLVVNGGKLDISTPEPISKGMTVINGTLAVNNADVTMDLKSSSSGSILVSASNVDNVVSVNGGSLAMSSDCTGTSVAGVRATTIKGTAVKISGGGRLSMDLASAATAYGLYASGGTGVLEVVDGRADINVVSSKSTATCNCINYSASQKPSVDLINGTVNLHSSKATFSNATPMVNASKIEVAADDGIFSEWDTETALKNYKFVRMTAHTHSFAEAWSSDADAHWHACTSSGCDIASYATCGLEGAAYGAHTDADGDFYCDVCNYYDEEAAKKADEDPVDPADPDEPDTDNYPKCDNHVTGFCKTYNSFRKTPVLNVIFNLIHQLIHAIKDFI